VFKLPILWNFNSVFTDLLRASQAQVRPLPESKFAQYLGVRDSALSKQKDYAHSAHTAHTASLLQSTILDGELYNKAMILEIEQAIRSNSFMATLQLAILVRTASSHSIHCTWILMRLPR
jgi:hypothetical protein